MRAKLYMCTFIRTTMITSNPLQVFWAVPIIVSFAIWDTKLGKVMYILIFVKDAIVLENVHQNQKNMIVATAIDDFFNAECMKKHRIVQGNEKKSICDLVKLCTKCGQQFQARKKNRVCKGKKKCHICKQIVDFSHRCYIQPYQSKINHDSDDE